MSDDLISRHAAIDALEEPPKVPDTWSDESAIGEREQWEKDVKALSSLPSAQPDVPDTNVGDLISRQAAIDEIARWIGYIDEDMILRIQTGLKKVPSAHRTGRWIFETLDGTPGYRPTVMFCSKCGRVSIADYSYCPNCGCAMEGEDDE